ncbi:MAG: biotin--[acetyl-CoA-carboxylase] ligase [Pseudomonadota bacterium]
MAFDAEQFRAHCREHKPKLGLPLTYQAVTGSTNDDALLAARSGAAHGSVFLADEQTAGRGRRGNVWHAAAGENLLFSVLLRPELELAQSSALTLAIGLALRDAIAPLIRDRALIKWPNDLLVGGRKLAGVLVESQLQGERLQALVVGVGLNVASREFPDEIAARATSLAVLGATRLAREPLLYSVLEAIAARVESYQQSGVVGLLDELNEADALRGQRLAVDGQSGVGAGIDGHGHLLLQDDHGVVHPILSGTVELQSHAPPG